MPSIEQSRSDFPFLETGTVFLDSAATSLKPSVVIDTVAEYYRAYGVSVHRGAYKASEQASTAFEQTREQVRDFINAEHTEEIIFSSGSTHSLNLAARLLAQQMEAGDEVIISEYEHHANVIPWQILAREKKLKIKYLTINNAEQVEPEQLRELITDNIKVLSVTHVSNASGYIMPVEELVTIAKEKNITVIIDAAQSAPHFPIDVQTLGADLIVFSAHKMCGPTGVGVLYGKKDLLEKLDPVFGGGSMIDEVDMGSCTWAELPLKLEPGTPNIAGVIGFGATITYLQSLGMENIHKHIHELYTYACEKMSAVPGVKLLGPDPEHNTGIISFTVDGIHPHDIGTILDQNNIAIRTGHHCAQPLMKHWDVPATARASLYFYNNKEDIDQLIAGLEKVKSVFSS